MNITSFFASTPRIGRLLATAAAVFAIGVLNPPAMRVAYAATTPVAVDQQPLSIRQTVPPNITLMLDDSGSMASDFMPDECNGSTAYLDGVSCDSNGNATITNNDALISSSNNGVYFNNAVNYALPIKADGSSWPAANFTSALTNGFTGSTTRNLGTYHNFNAANASNNYGNGTGNIGYSQSITVSTTAGAPYSPTCSAGYTLSGTQCQKNNYSASCPNGTTLQTGSTNTGKCKSGNGSKATYFYPCGGTDTYVSIDPNNPTKADICSPNPAVYAQPTCSGSDPLDSTTGLCTPQTQNTYSFFIYATKNTDGTYTRHYVGKPGTCTPAGLTANCDETAATQQNVANWFSYYHTRILMAKSSLMIAFSQVDPSFRIGFGSIDGSNFSATMGQNGTVSFTTSAGGDSYSTGVAQVAPFDTNCASNPTTCTPGATGTQRKSFWDWVTSTSPVGYTPLRQALDQVGQYYQTSQPWTTMATDPGYGQTNAPSNIACRQAYTILTTDGFWNDSFSSTTEAGASNAAWPAITGPDSKTWPVPAGSSPAAPYTGGAADSGPSLADVAMYYWENDLRPGSSGIANNVPISDSDPAFWQHMTTFTIGLGFTPTGITPASATIGQIFGWANGGKAPSNFAWPTPSSNSINNIADLAHAGVNGHGGFFSATDPNSFVNGLVTALNRATDRVGTGASLAANSTQLQTGTAVFQANYYTGNWKGGLKELAVNSNTGAIAINPTWSAQTQLANSVCIAVTDTNGKPTGAITCDNRNIQTYNPATGTFVAFKNTVSGSTATPPALSTAQLSALSTVAGTAVSPADVVSYLRGDSTLEQKNNGTFRSRDWPLGDIVDSQPVYEGAPDPNQFINTTFVGYTSDPSNTTCTSCSPFQDWAVGTTDSSGTFTASTASKRTGTVWVAGNDGMLHGFNATTGNEIYAYLPGALMVNSTDPVTSKSNPLANLADPAYGSTAKPHQYYNDGELTVVDAYVKLSQTSDTTAQWHTVLIGTTGRGPARAVYALDVTDPTNVTPLWERYANDSSTLDSNSGYIGQMVGKPVVAQTSGDGTAAGSWSVLIGNGYNSNAGTAALLQFDLATGKLNVHTTDTTTSNGLAAPLVWQDYPDLFMSDVAYAGDLNGNVWSFPLASVTTSKSTGISTFTATPTSSGVKLFTATDSTGKAQPITASPWAAQVPSTVQTANNPNSVWLFFGTGKYLTQTDVNDKSVQSWYGIMAQTTAGNGPVSAFTRADNGMVQRSIIAEQATTSSQLAVRAVTQPTPTTDPYSTTDMTGKKGWVMDLESPNSSGVANSVAQGERMVVPNQLQGNLLIGTTRIPKPTGDISDPCNPAGSGWIMAVNPFSGTGPVSNFFDTNGDGNINGSDTITVNGKQVPAAGLGFSSLPNAPIFIGGDMLLSFDNGSTATAETNSSSGGYSRVSWQELITN